MSERIAAILVAALIAASIGAAPGAASAQRIAFSESVENYQIHGRTADALLLEMKAKGPPPGPGGARFFARAEPTYTWDFSTEGVDGACIIRDLDISVSVHYTLPEWSERSDADKRLVAYWDAFMEALWTHERGHGALAVEDAGTIVSALLSAPPQADCAGFADDANRRAAEALAASLRQRDYDRETQHGKTQGAYFRVSEARRRR